MCTDTVSVPIGTSFPASSSELDMLGFPVSDSLFTPEDFPPLSSSVSTVVDVSSNVHVNPASSPVFTTPSDISSANSLHPMTTRAKDGIIKPNPKYALFTVKENYPEPKTVKTALKDPGWIL